MSVNTRMEWLVIFGAIGFLVFVFCGVAAAWKESPEGKASCQHPHQQHKLIQDTHHAVTIEGPVIRHDGVTIVRLKTPRGPEIAYLVDRGKYLAVGPLMNLKNGENVTPIWEKKYAP